MAVRAEISHLEQVKQALQQLILQDKLALIKMKSDLKSVCICFLFYLDLIAGKGKRTVIEKAKV